MAGSESVDIIRKASLASGNMRTHAAFRKGLREKETSGIYASTRRPPVSCGAHRTFGMSTRRRRVVLRATPNDIVAMWATTRGR
jgi:hypothetical protein